MNIMIRIIIFLFISAVVFNLYNDTRKDEFKNCKVIHLEEQQRLSGSDGSIKTDYRYLVITDKGTFIVENSLINGKFNNSDIFFRLKEDSTYDFSTCGIGKTLFTDYRNIIDFKKSNK